MLHFSPTEEQEEIRSLAHSLATEQLRPQGRSSEQNGDISLSLMQTLTRTGLTAPFPEIYGGSGSIEAITYAMIAEELAYGDGALATNIIGSMMGPLTVALAGSVAQQECAIPPFCASQTAPVRRGSLAFAEHTGGYALSEISATARRDGDTYILNGSKRNIIHGAQSAPRVVLLRSDKPQGLLALILPEQLTGLRISPDAEKLGLIAAPSASYTFEHAVVPASCALGNQNGVIRAVTLYAILRAGIACGTARAALEYASDYAKERIAFGRPIVSYQSIAFIIAETAMKLDAARLLLWNAASNWDRGVDSETLIRDAEAAQNQALKIGKAATIDAIQVMGGAGFIQDHPAEMWMRNAAAME